MKMNTYEQIKPVIDRMFQHKASIEDFLAYVRWELQECMNALPPEVSDEKSDGYHAGCCALRALSAVFQLGNRIEKSGQLTIFEKGRQATEPLLLVNLSPHDYHCFHEAKVTYSGSTGENADPAQYGGLAPYISTYKMNLDAAVKAMKWASFEVRQENTQWIARKL